MKHEASSNNFGYCQSARQSRCGFGRRFPGPPILSFSSKLVSNVARRNMDNTLQDILNLAEKGTIEQRCAALVVLGGLKAGSAAVAKAIAQLLKMLDDPDREIQERAVRSLGAAGEAAVQPLAQGLAGGSRVWQLNAARVLCQTRGKAAMKAVLHLLTAGTDDSNRAICDLLTPALREMDAREQNSFYDEVEAFAAKLDAKEQ